MELYPEMGLRGDPACSAGVGEHHQQRQRRGPFQRAAAFDVDHGDGGGADQPAGVAAALPAGFHAVQAGNLRCQFREPTPA